MKFTTFFTLLVVVFLSGVVLGIAGTLFIQAINLVK